MRVPSLTIRVIRSKLWRKQVEAAQAGVEAADATIKQAQAAIEGYTGRVVESNKEHKRQKTLDKQGATSKRAVETARANWVAYVNQKANAEAQLLQMQASLSEANANLAKAKADLGAPGEKNAQVRQGKAEVLSAELNLEFTQKKAPVDGYVTNLNLRLGSQAVENQPIMALVDVNSLLGYRVFQGKLHRRYSQGRPCHHHPHELPR